MTEKQQNRIKLKKALGELSNYQTSFLEKIITEYDLKFVLDTLKTVINNEEKINCRSAFGEKCIKIQNIIFEETKDTHPELWI